ncbi:MAG: LysR family transcriptional regulator [Clostridia bacterium]|nr:LysR family transcriptional regulator [Clostridia bacterium]
MFSKYKYVYAVHKEQSFTRAAQRLFISQPSLSAAIKNIEAEVGAPLFERCGGKVKLTEIGKEYIFAAEQIMSAENDFKRRINDIYTLVTGRLTVGGTNYLSSYVLPKIITGFSSLHPNIEVNLVEANSQSLGAMMKDEQIDIVIDSFDDIDELYEGYPLAKEQIFLCVPSTLAINEALREYRITPDIIRCGRDMVESIPFIPIEYFKNESFILLKNGNDMYYRAMKIFNNSGITPKVLFSVDQLNISYALAESGIGLCFVTDTLVKYGAVHGNVSFYNVGEEHCSRTLYIAYKHGRYCTRAMREFIEIARDLID